MCVVGINKGGGFFSSYSEKILGPVGCRGRGCRRRRTASPPRSSPSTITRPYPRPWRRGASTPHAASSSSSSPPPPPPPPPSLPSPSGKVPTFLLQIPPLFLRFQHSYILTVDLTRIRGDDLVGSLWFFRASESAACKSLLAFISAASIGLVKFACIYLFLL